MVGNSFSSAKNADAVLLIVDGRFAEPGAVEKKLLELCKENNKKVCYIKMRGFTIFLQNEVEFRNNVTQNKTDTNF